MTMSTYFMVASLTGILGLGYIFLIQNYLTAWKKLPLWKLLPNYQPKTSIDIIVPVRNEESGIIACLESILENEYPQDLFNVIVVNDYSTDQTQEKIQQLLPKYPNLQLLSLEDLLPDQAHLANKKAALEAGIQQGQSTLIITTDGDCVVPKNWLGHFAAAYEQNEWVFMGAPVVFKNENSSAFSRFVALDFLGMMLVTGAGVQQGWMHMSNGASLAFTREAFQAVDGYQGIKHLSSGDDMLLMQKIAQQFPGKIAFLKSSQNVVITDPPGDWKAFFWQRVRWASKSSVYPEWKVTFALALVFFVCWTILLNAFMSLFLGIPFLLLSLLLLVLKSVGDYLLLKRASHFFQRSFLMRQYPISQLYHILYIAIVGLAANLINRYPWKGKMVR